MKTNPGPRHAIEEPEAPPVFVERRRPGRATDVSPELIPLLRGQVQLPSEPDPDEPTALPHRTPLRGEWVLWTAWIATVALYGFLALGGWSWLFPATRL